EYDKDLAMIADLKDHIHTILLAKAGEEYGAAEVRDLCSWVVKKNARFLVEPIIEHPKSLKIVGDFFKYADVRHVVFGVHDFSKALGIQITPRSWPNELRVWRDMLLFEARLNGRGVVGGVDYLIPKAMMPDIENDSDVESWLVETDDENARV